ncbi:MAG: hypothetical protein NC429_12595 [Lachnospiraceae bacterium]|nr:hypothetical protein [Lachnospiraceae bacterium]
MPPGNTITNEVERKDKKNIGAEEICRRKGEKMMDGFGFAKDEKRRERKKLMRAGYVLAWTVLILMWAVLAARSTVMMG